MKRKAVVICIAIVCVIALFALLFRRPVFTESVSPDGMYKVQIWTRRGFGLLNVPEYLTITIRKTSSLQKTTIYAEIHNNDDPISPERNVRIIWKSNQLTIILLGCEQPREIITVSLEKGFPYNRYYDIRE